MPREVFVATIGRALRDRSFMLNLEPVGTQVEIVFTFWILREAGETVLIETGFPERLASPRGVVDYADPTAVMAGIGIDPADIRTILLSHLHWDHFAEPNRYPNATFTVQHDDLAYFTGPGRDEPAGKFADGESIAALDEIRAQGRLRIVDGNVRVARDLSLVRVGGHTPGLQIVVLDEPDGPTVFACDAAHLYENVSSRTPTSIIASYRDYQRGFGTIEQLSSGGRWFPGHDPKIFAKLRPAAPAIYRLT